MNRIALTFALCLALPAIAQEVPEAQRTDAQASLAKARRLLGRVGEFVGLTAATSRGRISAAGADVGLASAGALCAGQFGAGARMCTTQDIFQSAVAGKLGSAPIEQAWVFAPSWGQPVAGSERAIGGFESNCGSLTYPTADLGWRGLSFAFRPDPAAALKGVQLRAGTACSSQLRIACCR